MKKEKLTDKEIREAAEKEKIKRAEQTMIRINTILKETNCAIVPVITIIGSTVVDYKIIIKSN